MRPTLADENVKDGTMHQTLAHINTQKYPQILILDGAIPVPRPRGKPLGPALLVVTKYTVVK